VPAGAAVRPEFIEAARPGRHAAGGRWPAGERYLKVAGRWTCLYRAVDQHGQVIGVLLPVRRDLTAARRFFTRALRAGTVPVEVTTGHARVYPRVPGELIPSAGQDRQVIHAERKYPDAEAAPQARAMAAAARRQRPRSRRRRQRSSSRPIGPDRACMPGRPPLAARCFLPAALSLAGARPVVTPVMRR